MEKKRQPKDSVFQKLFLLRKVIYGQAVKFHVDCFSFSLIVHLPPVHK